MTIKPFSAEDIRNQQNELPQAKEPFAVRHAAELDSIVKNITHHISEHLKRSPEDTSLKFTAAQLMRNMTGVDHTKDVSSFRYAIRTKLEDLGFTVTLTDMSDMGLDKSDSSIIVRWSLKLMTQEQKLNVRIDSIEQQIDALSKQLSDINTSTKKLDAIASTLERTYSLLDSVDYTVRHLDCN